MPSSDAEGRALQALEERINQKVDFLVKIERRNKVVHTVLMTWIVWNIYCQTYNWMYDQEIVRYSRLFM